MEIKNLVGEVEQEGEKRVEEILAEARNERERIISEARREIEKRKDELRREAELTLERSESAEMMKARMKANQILDSARMQAMERIYEEFYSSLDPAEILPPLHAIGAKSLGDVETVYVSAKDAEAAKKLFRGASIEAAGIKGGIILEKKGGSERVNLSMEVVGDLMRSRTFPALYRILFGEK